MFLKSEAIWSAESCGVRGRIMATLADGVAWPHHCKKHEVKLLRALQWNGTCRHDLFEQLLSQVSFHCFSHEPTIYWTELFFDAALGIASFTCFPLTKASHFSWRQLSFGDKCGAFICDLSILLSILLVGNDLADSSRIFQNIWSHKWKLARASCVSQSFTRPSLWVSLWSSTACRALTSHVSLFKSLRFW